MNNLSEAVIPIGAMTLNGILFVPDGASRLVIFVHGSGSSRFSARNQYVANILQEAGIATLLFDLLTPQEEAIDEFTREFRFNIELLTERLIAVTDWVRQATKTKHLKIGYFGASTGAAAALRAASNLQTKISAVVSRGGRPDLAGNDALPQVTAPTLLIVGGNDTVVIEMNKDAMRHLKCTHKMKIVEHATHLFEEPGALQAVSLLAKDWFLEYG